MTTVTLILRLDQAERLTHGASDLLCWVRGYMAGIGDNASNAPFGQEEVRELNILLKDAIAETGNAPRA